MRIVTIVIVSLAALLQATCLRADITWNVTFNDVNNNTGIGFDDGTLGATRQATVLAVFDYINTVVDENGVADIRFNNSLNNSGSGVLASAGPFFFNTPGFSNGTLFDHATTGIDPSSQVPDATSTVNFGHNWNSGLGAPASNQFDLFTVLLHEVTHAMGYLSLLNSNGSSGIGPRVYSVYDSFLERGNGTALFDSNANFLGTAGDLTSNDVFLVGPTANVQVYAPSPFNPGSSIAHLDTAAHPDSVMNYALAPGVTKRVYSSDDLHVLNDIGWTLHAVPEPGTLAIWGILGSTAFVARARKRRKQRQQDRTLQDDTLQDSAAI